MSVVYKKVKGVNTPEWNAFKSFSRLLVAGNLKQDVKWQDQIKAQAIVVGLFEESQYRSIPLRTFVDVCKNYQNSM